MSDKTNLSKKIYKTILGLSEKLGKDIKIECEPWSILNSKSLKQGSQQVEIDDTGVKNYIDFTPPIEATQIRQILLAVKDELGDNPIMELDEETIFYEEYLPKMTDYEKYLWDKKAWLDGGKKIGYQPIWVSKSYSEALCNKWLDGLTPLFDSEPVPVLKELLEILENLLTNK